MMRKIIQLEEHSSEKNILIILPNNLGDVITALPVLEGLKKKIPNCRTTFLVEDGFEGGIENCFYCDHIFKFKRKNIRDYGKSEKWTVGLEELNEVVRILKQEKYSEIINLSQNSYTSYLTTLVSDKSEIKGQQFFREGNHAIIDKWSRYLFAIPFARKFNLLHVSDIYKRIADTVFATENRIFPPDIEVNNMRRFVYEKGFDPSIPFTVFQPGAAFISKRWSVENYIELGKRLISDGKNILLTGSHSEANIAFAIKEKLGERCLVSTGELKFNETISLLTFSDICITGDTAIMHAASALNKKVFALFGPTSPVETGPYGKGHFIFAGRCVNRPCFCFECKSKQCMKSIDPLVVYSVIKKQTVSDSSCDIFRTDFDENGIYKLIDVFVKSNPYINRPGASLIRKLFEPEYQIPNDCEENEYYKNQLIEYKTELKKMCCVITDYFNNKNIEIIRKFENIRVELNQKSGIAAFLNAVLNIMLNSIPLIDPIAGLNESRNACIELSNKIEKLVGK